MISILLTGVDINMSRWFYIYIYNLQKKIKGRKPRPSINIFFHMSFKFFVCEKRKIYYWREETTAYEH